MTIPLLFSPGKAPGDNLDFSLDFKNFLARGETIVEAHVTAVPDGLEISDATIARSVVTVFIADGELDSSYVVSYHIETSHGRTEIRSAILNVQAP